MVTMAAIIEVYATFCWSKKIGFKGWEMFVPGYNLYAIAEKATGKGLNCLWLLLAIIPFVGWLAALVILIIWDIRICRMVAEAYGAKTIWVFLIEPVYVPYFVFKDAPNCDDPINQFVTRIFKLDSTVEVQ